MKRVVKVGDLQIGGDSKVTVQSMTTTDTRDVKSTVSQIRRLEEAGCDIVRVAVLDHDACSAIFKIKKDINIPLVADIHFDYRLAIDSIKNGADKIRINPGNIGSVDRIKKIVEVAKQYKVPIRVGVNSGSLPKHIVEKYGVTTDAMVYSAIENAKILEDLDFGDIVVSLKASDVKKTIDAYTLMNEKTDYPLHVGVTEAGTKWIGTIKSSIGIGSLLAKGIGDTIRVSLTSDPVDEVRTGIEILKSLGIRKTGIKFISCPTCGRCKINLIEIAGKVQEKLQDINKDIVVAVMGCAVNGPGEAREADIGIAGGDNEALLFKKGNIIRKISEGNIVKELIEEIEKM
ncbi:MAG: flavodoxin-dependent (E)-4-hydroxy-3-methylbut-2-enyl-diphosphate synthase [Clostridiales bacterium]|nr:flavodoxin-dependent (E)-4-hydroxy-3-methylbut-2-enyl-diphosphate synthase [Clostridiales bacterium]